MDHFDHFCERHPVLQLLLVGIGGGSGVIVLADTAFIILGGAELLEQLSIFGFFAAAAWVTWHAMCVYPRLAVPRTV